jgi:anti-sigma B factor antagonist
MQPSSAAHGMSPGPRQLRWQAEQWRAAHERLHRPRVGGLDAFLIGAAQLAPQVTIGDASCAIGLVAIESQRPLHANSDDYAAKLDALQDVVGEGPVLDAFTTAQTQHAPQFGAEQRWPAFTRAALQYDVGSLLAEPLTERSGTTLGTLTLYSRHTAAFAAGDRERVADYALFLADAVSWYRLPAGHDPTTGTDSHPRAQGQGSAELEITCTEHENSIVVSLNGDLDPATSSWLRRQLLQQLGNRPTALIVALDQVPFMDATGLRALAEANRWARLVGTRFQITGPRRLVRKVLAITGMDKMLAIYPTVADALTDGPDRPPTLSSSAVRGGRGRCGLG